MTKTCCHATRNRTNQSSITTTRTTTATDTTQTLKLTGSITTAYDFSDDLNNPESDLFKEYASTVESEIGSIMMRSSMMQSVQLEVTGFIPVQAARKRRQAVGNVKAMAEFEALAEVPETVAIEDVQSAVEIEVQSASNEGLQSLDASSFNTIGIVVATTQAVASTPASTQPASTQASSLASTPLSTLATKATTEAIDEATTEATTVAATEAPTEATDEATEATTKATTKALTEAATEATTVTNWATTEYTTATTKATTIVATIGAAIALAIVSDIATSIATNIANHNWHCYCY